MKIREFLLLILIIVAGVAFYFVRTSGFSFPGGRDGKGLLLNFNMHTFEESLDIEAPLPSSLEVVNSFGGVEIRSADRSGIRLTLIKKIRNRKAEKAERLAGSLKPIISRQGDRLRITIDRGALKHAFARTDILLVVPGNLDVSVKNSFGKVNVSGARSANLVNRNGRIVVSDVEKDLSIDGSHGNIEVSRVGAACRIKSRHGKVQVSGIAGALRIDHRMGSVNVEDAGSDVFVSGDRSGVSVRRIKGKSDISTTYARVSLSETGPAVVKNRNGAVDAEGIRGGLSIENINSRVQVHDIEGPLSVTGKNLNLTGTALSSVKTDTSFGNIELLDFSGAAVIRLSHGNLILAPGSADTPIDVKNTFSRIRLQVPDGQPGPLEARVRHGRIVWNLTERPILNEQKIDEGLLKAFQGVPGHPVLLSLTTSDGDIVIEAKKTPTSF